MELIVKAKKSYPKIRISTLLNEFKVPSSSYYRKSSSSTKDENDYLLVKKVFEGKRKKIGIRQIKMFLERDFGIIMNSKKIARIKKKYGLETQIRKKNKFRFFAKKLQEHQTFPNLLDRKFKQNEPDKVYSTDITQINYGRKKAYLAAVKDLCTNEVVGSSLSNLIDTRLSNSALESALRKLSNEERKGLMIHSDQGFHFTHFSYRKKLSESGITQSMSRKGNCLDNAPIESFFGHFKDLLELEKCKTYEDLEKEVTRKIKYYNNERPQLGLKKMPPSEYRRHLFLSKGLF